MAHGVPEKYIKGGVIVGLVETPAEKQTEPPKQETPARKRKTKGEG